MEAWASEEHIGILNPPCSGGGDHVGSCWL